MGQPRPDFFDWFNGVVREAEQTPVGRFMLQDPGQWRIINTGGGCLAWEMRSLDGTAGFWICTDAQGLGSAVDEGFLVGIHPDHEWDDHWQGEAATIEEAVALCHAAHAARCFALFFRDGAKLTLAEFAATRQEVADLGEIDESMAGHAGLLYADSAYIHRTPDGYGVVLGNWESTADDPAKLEPFLYGFAYGEGYLDATIGNRGGA